MSDEREIQKSTREASEADAVVRRVEQEIYEHGGSRIFTLTEKYRRNLLADTYHTKEFAIDVKKFIEGWMKKHA